VLSAAVGAAGEGGLGRVGDRLLLLCYHYDPVSGRYAPLTWSLLRGGAAVVTLALVGFIGVSLVRERRRRGRGAAS
jgi:protein SCO1/2